MDGHDGCTDVLVRVARRSLGAGSRVKAFRRRNTSISQISMRNRVMKKIHDGRDSFDPMRVTTNGAVSVVFPDEVLVLIPLL